MAYTSKGGDKRRSRWHKVGYGMLWVVAALHIWFVISPPRLYAGLFPDEWGAWKGRYIAAFIVLLSIGAAEIWSRWYHRPRPPITSWD